MKEMEEEADRREREQLRAAIEEHKRLEMENQVRIKQRNLGLQRDLEMQMDYQGRLKDKQREEEKEEFLLGMVSQFICALKEVNTLGIHVVSGRQRDTVFVTCGLETR